MTREGRIGHLEANDPVFVRKRKHLLIAFFLRRLISGIQFGIIFSSAWQYLQLFHSPVWLYGVTVSIARVVAIMSSPFYGYTYDRTKRIREIFILMNVFDIVGSLVYALRFSIWFLLIGRVLTGFGESFRSVGSAEIACITSRKTRLVTYAKISLADLAGICLGPPLMAMFSDINIRLGGWQIDSRNVPGVFMAILWILMQLLTLFLVENVAKKYVDVPEDQFENLLTQDFSSIENDTMDDEGIGDNPWDHNTDENLLDKQADDIGERKSGSFISCKDTFRELGSPDIIILFLSHFLFALYNFSADASITLFTQEDFGWEPMYTTIVYVVFAIEITIIFILVFVVSTKVSDITFILVGMVCLSLSTVLWLFYEYNRDKLRISIPIFCVACIIVGASYPFFETGGRTLLSKVTGAEIQGIAHSIFSQTCLLAGALGPSWGVFFFTNMDAAVLIGLIIQIICVVWFLLSLRRLKAKEVLYSKLER